MSTIRLKFLAVIAATACTSFGAHAAPTIGFDNFDSNTLTSVSGAYVENGFQLSGDSLVVLGGTWNPAYSTGSNSMLSNNENGRITLTKVDGSAFTFNSIDISELFNRTNNNPGNVSFTAQRASGSTANYSVALDLVFGNQAVNFGSTFSDVTSVSWLQVSPYHQFDNLVMNAATGASAVPEPASLALVGMALAAVGVARRRGAKQA